MLFKWKVTTRICFQYYFDEALFEFQLPFKNPFICTFIDSLYYNKLATHSGFARMSFVINNYRWFDNTLICNTIRCKNLEYLNYLYPGYVCLTVAKCFVVSLTEFTYSKYRDFQYKENSSVIEFVLLHY